MTYTIAYRTGGTSNYRWIRTLPFPTKDGAEIVAEEIRTGGRKALVYATGMLDAIGLPETYEGPTAARHEAPPAVLDRCACGLVSFLNAAGECLRCQGGDSR